MTSRNTICRMRGRAPRHADPRPAVRSVDAGLVFERDAGSQGQRTETLEPRLMYSYVPYRNQNELPIFDTGLPDLNLVELFRTNRYVGDDRIGDANKLALGVTTRLFRRSHGYSILVGHHRTDPLFLDTAGGFCPIRPRQPLQIGQNTPSSTRWSCRAMRCSSRAASRFFPTIRARMPTA